jgi:3-methyladenine DNA glycosylase/8-oxoguanine DNA glycosylase
MSRRAVTHLKRADPVLAGVIEAVGPYRLKLRTEGTHFHAILRSITYQQLSGKAAATIHGRVLALYGVHGPTPAEILATPDEALRAAGLSRQKTAYIKDLAAHDLNGAIDRLHELSDDDVVKTLVAIKGVGRWTAHMVLMFRLGRPNIVPELDLGVRKAIQLAYRKRKMPTPKQVTALGAQWAPYGTIASWYLWRFLELPREKKPTKKVTARAPSTARSRSRRARPRTAAASPRPRH